MSFTMIDHPPNYDAWVQRGIMIRDQARAECGLSPERSTTENDEIHHDNYNTKKRLLLKRCRMPNNKNKDQSEKRVYKKRRKQVMMHQQQQQNTTMNHEENVPEPIDAQQQCQHFWLSGKQHIEPSLSRQSIETSIVATDPLPVWNEKKGRDKIHVTFSQANIETQEECSRLKSYTDDSKSPVEKEENDLFLENEMLCFTDDLDQRENLASLGTTIALGKSPPYGTGQQPPTRSTDFENSPLMTIASIMDEIPMTTDGKMFPQHSMHHVTPTPQQQPPNKSSTTMTSTTVLGTRTREKNSIGRTLFALTQESSADTIPLENNQFKGETAWGQIFHTISLDNAVDDMDYDDCGKEQHSTVKDDSYALEVTHNQNVRQCEDEISSYWYGQWIVPMALWVIVLPALIQLFHWLLFHWVETSFCTNNEDLDPIYVPTFVPGEGYVGMMDILDDEY